MFSAQIGELLKHARQRLKLSREELARRCGVSTRLVAELERGQRPNVSLETTFTLLNAVGVSVIAQAPSGAKVEMRSTSSAALERAARAEHRRKTWKGRHIYLHDEGDEPKPARSQSKRLAAVIKVSKQAYLIASAARGGKAVNAKRNSGR
jgi:transcriptional regulator with XRE-family HTH domain